MRDKKLVHLIKKTQKTFITLKKEGGKRKRKRKKKGTGESRKKKTRSGRA